MIINKQHIAFVVNFVWYKIRKKIWGICVSLLKPNQKCFRTKKEAKNLSAGVLRTKERNQIKLEQQDNTAGQIVYIYIYISVKTHLFF